MRLAAAVTALALASAVACSSVLPGESTYRLIPAESAIHFVGIKNNAVGVTGSFASLDGSYDAQRGTGVVEVQLASAVTGDAARDENLRTHFFEAASFPLARFEVSGLAQSALPAAGESMRTELSGTLALHGASAPLKVPVEVTRDGRHRLHVHNTAPIVLTAQGLGMTAQLAALKAVCGHESLSGAVPVDVELVFARVPND